MEYSGKILEIMQEEGVDVTNPDELLAAFQNERLMKKARKKGNQKGIPIGIIDAISGGIAGRLIGKTGTTIGGKLIRGTGEVVTQATLGMTGEVAGEISAGEALSPPDILAEGFGEVGAAIPPGAFNIYSMRLGDKNKAGAAKPPSTNNKIDLKQRILDNGATVTAEKNVQTGLYETTMLIGDNVIKKSEGFETIEQAEEVKQAMLDAIGDITQDKTIEYEGERPPALEAEQLEIELKEKSSS